MGRVKLELEGTTETAILSFQPFRSACRLIAKTSNNQNLSGRTYTGPLAVRLTKPALTGREPYNMCRVWRIENSCGHVNDHVIMVCTLATPKQPLSARGAPQDRTNEATTRNDSIYLDRSKIAEIGLEANNSRHTTATSSKSNSLKVGHCHAWTDPYCVHAEIREEPVTPEYQCMVEGCGRSG